MSAAADRVGLSWRPCLALEILAHLDRVDVLEVLAEDVEHAGRAQRDGLRRLGREVPLVVHGTALGLASTIAVDARCLDTMARAVECLEPEGWSEHLAFVRAGGVELGHLAAPPRTAAVIEGLARNVDRARRVVGRAPALENVATPIDPPGSDLGEMDWLAGCLEATQAPLLLDLHNLHVNALNFGFEAETALDALPLGRLGYVHLAGGHRGRRWVDDHLHAVPEPVFDLLAGLAERTPGPLTVVLERDGRYPPLPVLLAELDQAREALARGRARREHARV